MITDIITNTPPTPSATPRCCGQTAASFAGLQFSSDVTQLVGFNVELQHQIIISLLGTTLPPLGSRDIEEMKSSGRYCCTVKPNHISGGPATRMLT